MIIIFLKKAYSAFKFFSSNYRPMSKEYRNLLLKIKMSEKISVLMTSYNASNFNKDPIISIMRQSYKNWELVIVDDCSNDNSVKIIKRFKEKRIKLFTLNKHIGRTKALNYG